jgi:transposase
MWKPEHRIAAAARRGLRYPSDMSDAEWALVEPMIPPGRRGGRPRGVNLRESSVKISETRAFHDDSGVAGYLRLQGFAGDR